MFTNGSRIPAIMLICGIFALRSSCVVAQEAPSTSPAVNYSRLTEPKLAEAIELTDEQRSRIATILNDRAAALAKATPEERAQVAAKSDKELEAVLSDAQRERFAKETVEPRLRFNFRFQKWADVLEWLAKQSDLSLVLDAPPPGTFNYSDSKEYTSVEAQDLINGVLSTKGYTLIRRGRMLMVIDVQEGIPDGLIPRIPLEELDKRGKFELVSVMFPLGGRDPQSVKTEITPLLGPFGKCVPLPQTKQILVTDTAGIMRAVNAVISSIPEPSTPPAPPAVVPEAAVYSVKAADAKVAEEVLSKMFPSAKIVADLKAEQVNAFATPTEQAAIKAVIDQMQAHNPPEKKPILEVYPVSDQDTTQLVANLTLVAPTARLSFDSRQRQIVAFASPADQANLKIAIEKLAMTAPAERTRQLEIYRLSKADPTTTLTLLQGLLPQARLSVDPQTRRIVAFATPADHKSIEAILEQLQTADPGPDTQVLEFYAAEQPLSTSSITMLTTLAPKAKIVFDPDTKRLQVLATPSDQSLIKTNLDEIQKELPPAEKRKLVVYRVTSAQRTRFTAVQPSLVTDFPDIKVVPEGEPGELAIWAKPSQHELLKVLIDSLATEPTGDEKPELITYPLRAADPTTATTLLKTMVPQAKVSLDTANKTLVAIALPEDHALIRSTLEKLQPGEPGPDAPIIRFYPLAQPLPTASITAFAKLAPKATVTPDVDGKWLQVVATEADHKLIKTTLDDLLKELPVVEKRKLIIYPVTTAQRTRFQSALPSMTTDLPDVKVLAGGEPNELAIWAKPTQHEIIKLLLESLESDEAGPEKQQLVTYPLRSADPTTTSATLKSLVPDAKISLDTVNKSVIAIAVPDDHKLIKSTIEKLQPGEPDPDAPVVRFYELEQPLPATSVTAFARLVPKATVTADTEGRWLQVVASPTDHDLIKSHLDELLKGLPAAEKKKLVVYTVTPAQRIRFQAVLPSLKTDLPDIRVVTEGDPNELAIWAKPSQHEMLKGVFAELEKEAPVAEKYRLVSYPLKATDATAASTMLQTLFPGTKITVEASTNRLLIWTRPTEHVAIKEALEELDSDEAGDRRDKVMVYPVPEIDPDVAIGLLKGVLPKVQMMKDTKARTIVAWGKKSDHETIARTLTSMRSSADEDTKPHLKIFPAGKINATSIVEVLRVTLPNARIAVDAKTGGVAALGTKAEHEQIQSAIAQMVAQSAGQSARLATYNLTKSSASAAIPILAQAVPEAKASVGQDSSQLVVWARNEDQEVVDRIVEQLEADSGAKKSFELRAYTLKATGAAATIPLLTRAVPKAVINPGGHPNRIVAWASAADHEVIAQVVKQLDSEHAADTSIEFLDLLHIDTDAALKLAQTMLQKDSVGTTVSLIQGTNQLYVEARPEQIEMIREGLKRLRSNVENTFEVYQLETVDPYAADSLIRRMFIGTRGNGPVVEVDSTQQKLYVRGTKEQLGRIRELLEKMGETELSASAAAPGAASARKVRVIPFGGDAANALQEIQRVWPSLRSNELRVISNGESKSNLMLPRSSREPQVTPVPARKAPNDSPEKNKVPPAPAAPSDLDDENDDEEDLDEFANEDFTTEEIHSSSAKKNEDGPRHTETHHIAQALQPEVSAESKPAAASETAPIVILPRDGNITIFSDDTEALDQLDKLLRAVSGPKQTGGRGFGVYALRYAGATSVAETVRSALKTSSGGGVLRMGNSAPTVVADERLNAIVVYGSRSDRASIEKLLEALDSSDIPDSKVSNIPRRVPVKNGSAQQIEQVLRLVYKTQLSTGGGRKEIPVPSGLAPEVAQALQQINAMNTGPLLALSVDEATNSIVIMAPAALVEQVRTLIEELDEAALSESTRGVSIIPLEHMNSSRTQKVLNQILEKSRRRDRR